MIDSFLGQLGITLLYSETHNGLNEIIKLTRDTVLWILFLAKPYSYPQFNSLTNSSFGDSGGLCSLLSNRKL